LLLAAFVAQWGIGAVINPWQVAGGGYDPRGYQMVFGLLLVLQVLAAAWFLLMGSKELR
jgi:hypothetical protein